MHAGIDAGDCDRYVDYMLEAQSGRHEIEGYTPKGPDDWGRLIVRNCHNPMSLAWLTDARLRQPAGQQSVRPGPAPAEAPVGTDCR